MEHVKYYKTCPKHPYWFNGGRIEFVRGSNGTNNFQWIDLTTNVKGCCIIIGYRLFKGYKKATEQDWNEALKNVK